MTADPLTLLRVNMLTPLRTSMRPSAWNRKARRRSLNRGVAFGNDGKVDKGIADCSTAINLKPAYADAYFNRGCIFDRKVERDKAKPTTAMRFAWTRSVP